MYVYERNIDIYRCVYIYILQVSMYIYIIYTVIPDLVCNPLLSLETIDVPICKIEQNIYKMCMDIREKIVGFR